MKTKSLRLISAALLTACAGSSVGCYPVSYYQPAYAQQDSKGYNVPQAPAPPPPTHYAVDPGLAVAGVAAAGLLGYAIGSNHAYYHGGYYGPPPYYYRPVPYYRGGYYRPRYYH